MIINTWRPWSESLQQQQQRRRSFFLIIIIWRQHPSTAHNEIAGRATDRLLFSRVSMSPKRSSLKIHGNIELSLFFLSSAKLIWLYKTAMSGYCWRESDNFEAEEETSRRSLRNWKKKSEELSPKQIKRRVNILIAVINWRGSREIKGIVCVYGLRVHRGRWFLTPAGRKGGRAEEAKEEEVVPNFLPIVPAFSLLLFCASFEIEIEKERRRWSCDLTIVRNYQEIRNEGKVRSVTS